MPEKPYEYLNRVLEESDTDKVDIFSKILNELKILNFHLALINDTVLDEEDFIDD